MSHNTAVPDVGEAEQRDDELVQVDTVVPWTYQAGGTGRREHLDGEMERLQSWHQK